MSRIEKALEKAAKLRSETTSFPKEALPKHTSTPSNKSHSFQISDKSIQVDNLNLLGMLDPASSASEEYRKLKSELVKSTRIGGKFLNMVMVASAVASEGKSLTALNLALCLAQDLDHTVLLVDADFRRPSIHRYLGIESSKGLSDCLSDDIDPSDVLINTGIGKLVLFPAGKEVPNPVELFSSQKAKDLFNELKHRYSDRYVIIDTPPLLPFAESRQLSHLVDAIVLVVREKQASQLEIVEAIEALKGTNLLGIVYNNANVNSYDKRYSQYYTDSYVRAQQ